MNAVFFANIQLEENEGIYKKIKSQAQGIANTCGNCFLITKYFKGAKIHNFVESESIDVFKNIFDSVWECIKVNNVKLIYIRHMIPSFKLIRLLYLCKKNDIKILYEIPTYPYFAEQFKVSKRKHRALIKILLDIFFMPIIYKYVDNMIIIKSNTKVKLYKKMVEITNGADTSIIKTKENNNMKRDKFSLVTVGTLYPYHGYDRILKGLSICNERVGEIDVELSIIGKSNTIDELKKLSQELNLKNVHFLGIKNVEEMNGLFENYDLGLGCMALHRRNADIDTTIKIIEYYCRGILVATSGISPMDLYNKDYTIRVDDGEDFIDIQELYNEFVKKNIYNSKKISKCAKDNFSWDTIMHRIICGG